MALRDRPMNREEIEEVLEYLSHYSRPLHVEDGVITGSRRAQASGSGFVFFDEAPTPPEPPSSTQSGPLPERPITAEGVEEAVESIIEGTPMMQLFEAGARMILDGPSLPEFFQLITEPPPTSRSIHTVPSPREMFENSGAQHYTTFDEAKHRVHYALKELGKPHLVGLEWEPQATLLNHPNRSVHVILTSSHPDHIYRDKGDVSIALPRSMGNFVDIRNGALEVRSQAVQPESLHFAINRANTQLEILCKQIAEMYGPCALFLPANDADISICTKHYQASWIISNDKDTDRLYGVFNAGACYGRYYSKDGRRHQMRVHINVPYEFIGYSEIEYAWFQAMSDIDYTLPPRLLCYSYTGEDVVSVSKLT